ncbi:MAG: response regulator [Spirochaetales bacterium]
MPAEMPLPKRILLVEDEPIIALAESQMLKNAGYACVIAPSGERAIEVMDQGEPIDLILMDINLGKGIDGTEAAQHILSRHDIPLVFLSCYTDPETVNKTEDITSYGYIVKTSGPTVILTSIRMAFRLFEANRQIRFATQVFRTLAKSGASSGEQVFQYLVQHTAAIFQSTYAFVSLIDPSHPSKAHTLAVWKGEGFGQNFSYDLKGTPCADAIEHEECYVENEADKRYPEDPLLVPMGIKSYWGIRLLEGTNEPIGILAAADTKPLRKHPWSQDILHVLAERARSEIHRLRLERELVMRKMSLESLIAGIPLPVFYKDSAGRYLGVNEAFCRFLKKSKEEIIGETVYGIAPRELADIYREKDLEVLKEGEVQRYISKAVDGEGGVHTVQFHKAPIRDEEGSITGIIGLVLPLDNPEFLPQ